MWRAPRTARVAGRVVDPLVDRWRGRRHLVARARSDRPGAGGGLAGVPARRTPRRSGPRRGALRLRRRRHRGCRPPRDAVDRGAAPRRRCDPTVRRARRGGDRARRGPGADLRTSRHPRRAAGGVRPDGRFGRSGPLVRFAHDPRDPVGRVGAAGRRGVAGSAGRCVVSNCGSPPATSSGRGSATPRSSARPSRWAASNPPRSCRRD